MQLNIIVRNGIYLRYYFELIWRISNMIRRKKVHEHSSWKVVKIKYIKTELTETSSHNKYNTVAFLHNWRNKTCQYSGDLV